RKIEWVINPLPKVRADPALFRQVLVNLLGNAVKYTRNRPSARIEIGHYVKHAATPAGTNGSPAQPAEDVFFVRDNGAGFDMRYVDKLFGVFQRLHTTSEFECTGI